MSQHITVVDYNPYGQKYEEEALLIKDILADNCVAIYHIGSTCLSKVQPKPIIDIMAAVQNLEKVDDAAEAFSKIGYEYLLNLGQQADGIFVRVEMRELIKFISFKQRIGIILKTSCLS